MRRNGILLPVLSLPSKYGIGSFSKEAYEFIDNLLRIRAKIMANTSFRTYGIWDSPYQSFSTFAGNPYFIDLDTLVEEGLLSKEECESYDLGRNEDI